MSLDQLDTSAPDRVDSTSSRPAAPPPTTSTSPWVAALLRVIREPTFLIVAAVLLVAALGLNAAVGTMKLHFKKEPVPLKRPLGTIPAQLNTWVQVSPDQALDKDMQDALGTDKYIFRDYVDQSVLGPDIADEFRNKTQEERQQRLAQIRMKHPTAVVSMSVTYYTGMVDTVAHVPDRCVTADGYEPKTYDTADWPIGRQLPPEARQRGDDVEVRYINFEDQTGASRITRSIAYFFHANGKWISSPLGVRRELADLFQKRGYYAKIECMMALPPEQEMDAPQKLQDFLSHALPEIHRCMPDWDGGSAQPEAAPQQVAAK